MSYTITIQPSGHEITCEEDETVLDAALRQGIAMPYGCRNGACGNCMGKILSGEVDYGGSRPLALSESDEIEGRGLFCQAYAIDDLSIEIKEIGAAKDIQIKTLPVRVHKLDKAADDVMIMQLKLPASERLQFLAGQYIEILLKDGKRRAFSLANAPHQDDFLELHLRHVPDGHFTGHVFNQMKEKALLRIEGPLGSFFLREDSERPILMIAGGTGFAPMKGIIEHVMEMGITRPIQLYWGVRAKKDLYFNQRAELWTHAQMPIKYIPVLSEPDADDHWLGRTGWVHDAVLADHADLSGFDVYMAGPPPMINAAKEGLMKQGLPEDQLYYDSFDYSADSQQ